MQSKRLPALRARRNEELNSESCDIFVLLQLDSEVLVKTVDLMTPIIDQALLEALNIGTIEQNSSNRLRNWENPKR